MKTTHKAQSVLSVLLLLFSVILFYPFIESGTLWIFDQKLGPNSQPARLPFRWRVDPDLPGFAFEKSAPMLFSGPPSTLTIRNQEKLFSTSVDARNLWFRAHGISATDAAALRSSGYPFMLETFYCGRVYQAQNRPMIAFGCLSHDWRWSVDFSGDPKELGQAKAIVINIIDK